MVGYVILAAVLILILFAWIRVNYRRSHSIKAYLKVINQTIKRDINGNECERICEYADGRIETILSVYDSENRLIKIIGDAGNGHKYTQSYMFDKDGIEHRGLFTTLAPEADIYEVYERILSRMKRKNDNE